VRDRRCRRAPLDLISGTDPLIDAETNESLDSGLRDVWSTTITAKRSETLDVGRTVGIALERIAPLMEVKAKR
jgi:hypothetical protein